MTKEEIALRGSIPAGQDKPYNECGGQASRAEEFPCVPSPCDPEFAFVTLTEVLHGVSPRRRT